MSLQYDLQEADKAEEEQRNEMTARQGVNSVHPKKGRRWRRTRREDVACGLVVAGGDASQVHEAVEYSFTQAAHFVDLSVERHWHSPTRCERDHRRSALGFQASA